MSADLNRIILLVSFFFLFFVGCIEWLCNESDQHLQGLRVFREFGVK